MEKYLTVFTISWQNEFIYRINFILWRFRNVLRFLMTYFLWSGIFVSNKSVFGYSQTQMFTYVFMVLAVSAIVLSAPSSDQIGGEIASGNLSNYLLKPVSYLKYWFTRDLSSKLLNLIFASFEIGIMWFVLKPQIQLPSFLFFLVFLIICVLAVILYYFLTVSVRFVAFWSPENPWPLAFLTYVLIEILGGAVFPLDILPSWLSFLLQFTPFPYLLYFPIATFTGRIVGFELFRVILQTFIWVLLMSYATKFLWRKGLYIYGSEGR